MARPLPSVAFSGFGATAATATFGAEMRFSVELPGGPPDRLELLLRFGASDSTVVAPVDPDATSAAYVWDTADRPITPNTPIAYRWRATTAGVVTLSPEKSLLYDDDRPGLNWSTARIGDATVHWYGGAEAQARHFGAISADAAAAGETLLGHALAGPIDIFVYDSREDFFGVLGPGAREWTGAATFPALRTIFMWLGGGSGSYLETTMTHEVTHVVFHDATVNPFHEPAKWFNEGLAVWSEEHSAATEAGRVRSAADGGGGLLAFDGISESFPISAEGARLAYGQGATMVEMIIDTYGREAIADIAAAWRDGAGDDEALEAGTGVSVEELYDAYFASFGVEAPTAIEPAPILPSNVDKPPQPPSVGDGGPQPSAAPSASRVPEPGEPPTDAGWILVAVVGAGLALGVGAALAVRRRRPPGVA
jgi:hypothetical protein